MRTSDEISKELKRCEKALKKYLDRNYQNGSHIKSKNVVFLESAITAFKWVLDK